MIANAHLVWADLSPIGARCEQCLQLAALHSKAVDFPKSGIPAVFPKVRRSPRVSGQCVLLRFATLAVPAKCII